MKGKNKNKKKSRISGKVIKKGGTGGKVAKFSEAREKYANEIVGAGQ